jgi:hypothetical protein
MGVGQGVLRGRSDGLAEEADALLELADLTHDLAQL